MEQNYFSLKDIIQYFEKMGYSIDFEYICGCVRRRTIHPVIYVDSIPAFAYTGNKKGEAVARGFCYLSAYLHEDCDVLIGICDNLIRGTSFMFRHIVKEKLTQITPNAWCTESHYFEEVPKDLFQPAALSKDLEITGFMFPADKPFVIERCHIAISEEDLNALSINVLASSKANDSKKVSLARRASGKLSGHARKKESTCNWERIKPALLNIAQKCLPTTPNKIATLAVKYKIIPQESLSNTAKNIRKDKDFKPFIK